MQKKDILINSNKTYLFSRALVNKDFGALGKSSKIGELGGLLEKLLARSKDDNLTTAQIRAEVTSILTRNAKNEKSLERRRLLARNITEMLNSASDLQFFALTCKSIMPLLNSAVEDSPLKADVDFIDLIQSLVDQGVPFEGAQFLALNALEQKEIDACLEVERQSVIRYTERLTNELDKQSGISQCDKLVILTGFIQEAERRIGQKRKVRSGHSVKNVIGTLLDLNGVSRYQAPEEADLLLDADFWVSNGDKLIGIVASHNFRNDVLSFIKRPSEEKSEYIHILVNKRDMKVSLINSIINLGHAVVVPDQHYLELKGSVGEKGLIRMRSFISDHIGSYEKSPFEDLESIESLEAEEPIKEADEESEVNAIQFNYEQLDSLAHTPGFESSLIGTTLTERTNEYGERVLAYVYNASALTLNQIKEIVQKTKSNNVFVRKFDSQEEIMGELGCQSLIFPSHSAIGVGYSSDRAGVAVYSKAAMVDELAKKDKTVKFFERTIEPSSLSEFGPYFVVEF